MKTNKFLAMMIALIPISYMVVSAQELKIPVENTKTGKLILEGFSGNLPIEGYNGKEIIITGEADSSSQEVPERAKGLKPINGNGNKLGLQVEKNDNRITVRCSLPPSKSGAYKFKVPENLSLEISGNFMGGDHSFVYNFKSTGRNKDKNSTYVWASTGTDITTFGFDGDSAGPFLSLKDMPEKQIIFKNQKHADFMLKSISIRNMKNEVEINNINSINLTNVTGPLVLSTINGDINVVFSELNKDKPTSLSTVKGEVDVTLPSKTQTNLEFQTMSGTVFSNFDFPADNKSSNQIGGTTLKYPLNGGGVDFKIVTVKGNIYLRKGK